ncbi:MAG: cytochrome c maturation protein CcmE [Magnetococcales bacterium]|nr:cytochrome c maturation protein CcmE [Magnetococcales bacterium]MBF0419942.1 cytochrome c maturation protein CcmE [Magnetococcales bacterium]
MSKNRRIFMILTLLIVGGALGALVWTSFTGSLVYFYTPTEMQTAKVKPGQKVRIGGMVQEGSLVKETGTLKMRFLVTDGSNKLAVRYEGMPPDLFREGQGVVVEGPWQPGQDFIASTILAKHSEDYTPVQMTQEGIARSRENMLRTLK